MSVLLLLTIVQNVLHTTVGGDTKVLLVSMDGFRNDYLTKTKTPNFDKLIASGVTMDYMNNSFVTNTFPCHYTMATGLYAETHGIVSNDMYDPEFNSTFSQTTTESRWWEGGEPIWITAVKHDLKSGVYFWPGSEAAIHNRTATEWRKYNQTVSFEARVDAVVSWLSEGKFDLGVMYFHEPDSSGHRLGPDDPKLLSVIEDMDRILGYLMQKIENFGLKAVQLHQDVDKFIEMYSPNVDINITSELSHFHDYVKQNYPDLNKHFNTKICIKSSF